MIINTAEKCIQKQVEALNGLFNVIRSPEYNDVIGFLMKHIDFENYTNRLIITGVGKNSNIASKISETMASLGIPSFYLNTAHVPHGDLGFVGPNDAVIHISRSGTTDEMLFVIDQIKRVRPSVKQILVHCNAKKQKPSGCDFELFTGAVEEGDDHGLAPTSSTTLLLCALDCISVTLSKSISFKRTDFLNFHPAGALGALLKAEQEKAGK